MTNFILGALATLLFSCWSALCIIYGFKIGNAEINKD